MTVETNLTVRWEKGMKHHPKSIQIYKAIEKLDWEIGNDYLNLSSGGDGDNGEHIMYLLDVYFERLEERLRIE